MGEPRLTIELVPETAWYTNVRSNVSAADWNECKSFVRERSNDRCEVCGGRGRRWPVECHEVWEYDEQTETIEDYRGNKFPIVTERIQRLVGLIALCPACHEVKHIGRAEATGHLERALTHLAKVNGWTLNLAAQYADGAFRQWRERSRYEWTLDISYLSEVLDPEEAFQ